MSGVKRATVHLPPKDGWPETLRGVGFRQSCPICNATIRAPKVGILRTKMRNHRAEHVGDPPE